MLNSRTERKAIYATASFFTEIGWFFREQSILDFGIDAFVEIGKGNRPSGSFIALQIKGGDSNFHKSKKGLTFYFGEIHKQYWLDVGKTFPVLIILQDPADGSLYWEQISDETISKTPKNWKVIIPCSNRLALNSKPQIENLLFLHRKSESYSTDYSYLIEKLNKKNEASKPNIYFQYKSSTGLQCVINKKLSSN